MKVQSKMLAAVLLSSSLAFPLNATGAQETPNRFLTQTDFVVELVNELGIDVQSSEDITFENVSEDVLPYLQTAQRVGIIDDSEDFTFNPNERITREDAYTLLVRSLNLSSDYHKKHVIKFRDYRAISAENLPYVSAAAALDLVIEDNGRTLKPNKKVDTRTAEEMFDNLEEEIDFLPIIHTNDLHGRIAYNAENGELGLAKVSTLVNDVRSENPDAFLFDMGDTLHGTAVVNNFNGAPAIEMMNQMEYDAMVPGNHDFNFGNEYLLEAAGMMNFPVISGNILKDGEDFLDDYTIIERDGKTFGLIGMTATDTAVKTSPKNIVGIEFQDEVTRTQEIVDQIEDEVDHIILLSHSGLETDEVIADEVEGVDLILGGHSHDTLESPKKYENAYVTQAFEYGKAVGHTNLVFADDQLVGVNGFLYRDKEDLAENEEVASILTPYQEAVDELLGEVIGETPVALDGARASVRTQETNLGNLIADSMRSTLGTDVAFTNGGGIRASIDAGEVTRGDVEEVLPFINTLVQMTVTGEQIKAALEHSVRLAPEQNGGFLHISGMSFKYDASQPAGSRVTEVLVGGEPLDITKEYTAATNDFTAIGGDGYSMFSEDLIEFNSGELLSAILIDAIASGQPIPEVEGRIVAE
ncbi:5'-nucleotidase C-terminal domain-containing protein [Jeotgalibacillus sp. R-1-5s-1]|uniref:5'-nucleotidase C-terminal domain-containing protein n=1 Tax=Jeotgalibacillus sp. R-1-5s-1 TaxID=2555897 RepID=UPI00106B33C1|nr:5'-nucleotidase C-terminal domain-containing protein [Jeotgalibacillus sp. R-1-5s-1]TFD95742.1 bifunctional metallophosphatase/5'-nucleotidase [Jeotgalibacillus sp. R-1-5s-1]